MFCEMIFSCQSLNIWISIYALIGSQFTNSFWLHSNIGPVYVPVRVLIWVALYIHFTAHTLHYVITAILGAQDQLLLLTTTLSFFFRFSLFSSVPFASGEPGNVPLLLSSSALSTSEFSSCSFLDL